MQAPSRSSGRFVLLAVSAFAMLACKEAPSQALRPAPSQAAPPLVNPAAAPRTEAQLLEYARAGFPKASWRLANLDLQKLCVSASHILVSFQGAHTGQLKYPVSLRSQARTEREAARIAVQLAGRLSQEPAEFEKLAREVSDDLTTSPWEGALGVVRGDQLPLQFIDALATMEVGQVAHLVVPTSAGFHILKRTALPERRAFRVARILVPYEHQPSTTSPKKHDPVLPAREAALRSAESIAKRARAAPAAFIRSGAGQPGARSEVAASIDPFARQSFPLRALIALRLKPGEISPVLDTTEGFELLQRQETEHEDGAAKLDDAVIVDIPRPLPRTMRDHVALMSSRELATRTRQLRTHVMADARLRRSGPRNVDQIVGRALGELADGFEREPDAERSHLLERMRAHLSKELSAEELALTDASIAEWFARATTRSPARVER
jgi:hypothetical protein